MAKKKAKKGMKLLPSILLVFVVAITFGFSALNYQDYTQARYDSIAQTGIFREDGSFVKGEDAKAELRKQALKEFQVFKIGEKLQNMEKAVDNNETLLANNTEYQALKTTYTYMIVMLVFASLMLVPFAIDVISKVIGKASKKKGMITYCINFILAIGVIVMAGLAMGELLPLYQPTNILGVTITPITTIGLAFPMIIGFAGALVLASGVTFALKRK